jgi:predicted nucleotidyltransferase
MNPNATLSVLDGKMDELAEVCRRFHVKRLEIFGSAVTGTFRPGSRDLDFLVNFGDQPLGPWGALFIDFADALEALFGCRVDLIIARSIRNPYIRQAVDAPPPARL